jgi:hypothetical protein
MHLRQQAELRVRDRRHVEDRRLPLEPFAPRDALEPHVGFRASLDQQPQDRRSVIEDRIDSVKQRRVTVEPVLVYVRGRVDVRTHLNQRTSRIRAPVLRRHVQHRRANQRCKCRHHRRPMFHQRRILVHRVGIVEKDRRDRGVVQHGAAIQQRPDAVGKPRTASECARSSSLGGRSSR